MLPSFYTYFAMEPEAHLDASVCTQIEGSDAAIGENDCIKLLPSNPFGLDVEKFFREMYEGSDAEDWAHWLSEHGKGEAGRHELRHHMEIHEAIRKLAFRAWNQFKSIPSTQGADEKESDTEDSKLLADIQEFVRAKIRTARQVINKGDTTKIDGSDAEIGEDEKESTEDCIRFLPANILGANPSEVEKYLCEKYAEEAEKEDWEYWMPEHRKGEAGGDEVLDFTPVYEEMYQIMLRRESGKEKDAPLPDIDELVHTLIRTCPRQTINK